MDASRLTVAFALLGIGYVVGRFVVTSLSGAGDVMASLFVPPDRSLGWPRGVQERDEPWGWRDGPGRGLVELAPPPGGDEPTVGRPGPDAAAPVPGRGSLVVPLGRVAPVHLGLRPH